MIFKFMLSHAGMFEVVVKLGECNFKSIARMSEVFVQFQIYAESCQSV